MCNTSKNKAAKVWDSTWLHTVNLSVIIQIWKILVRKAYMEEQNNFTTRRYPWGIQRLVSTHSGGGVFLATQKSKSQVLINFHFLGRGHSLPRIGYSWKNKPKILHAQARSCITVSLSHTMCVETKGTSNGD